MDSKQRWNATYWLIALLAIFALQSIWQTRQIEPVPYSEFEKALADGKVAEVVIGERTLTGRLKQPEANGKTVLVATRVEPDLAEQLSKYNVTYTRVVESTLLRDIISWVAPAAVFWRCGTSCSGASPRSRAAWAAS